MKKKIITYLVVMTIFCAAGCGKSDGKVTPTEDTKPSESQTTEVATVGKDAEAGSVETESTSKKTETTTKKKETTAPETTKKQETTKQQESTTKKKTETTTKKKTETTKQQTTTKNLDNNTNAAPTNKPSGYVTVEIKPSVNADKEADKIIASIISKDMSEYERVKAIHDWIVINVQYDYAGLQNNTVAETAYNADGALRYKLAVCQGYAEAFQLLCAKAGVQAQMMYGEAGNDVDGWQSHAWNVVRINGEWYQIDCTWDDPLVNGVIVTGDGNLSYTYFLLTDVEMYYDHKLDAEYTKYEKVCKSTLFYGYAKYLTLDRMLSEFQYSATVNSSEQLKYISKDFTKQGARVFKVAVLNSISKPTEVIQQAVYDELVAAGITGTIRFQYTYQQAFDYVIYEVEVTID